MNIRPKISHKTKEFGLTKRQRQFKNAEMTWTKTNESGPSIEVMNFFWPRFISTVLFVIRISTHFAMWCNVDRIFRSAEPSIERFSFQCSNFHQHWTSNLFDSYYTIWPFIIIILKHSETCQWCSMFSIQSDCECCCRLPFSLPCFFFSTKKKNIFVNVFFAVVICSGLDDYCCCCCYSFCCVFFTCDYSNKSCSPTNWKLKLFCSLFNKLNWVSNW